MKLGLEETDSHNHAMEMIVTAHDRDAAMVMMPRSEVHIVVRRGPAAKDGLDIHVFGALAHVRRKIIRAGQRIVMARLPLGASLGVPPSELTNRIVSLDELWGDAATRRLRDRLATAADTCATLRAELIIAPARSELAHAAATRLTRGSVNAVAAELGVSDRQLRRVFRGAFGVSPKSFAKLARFHRALAAARAVARPSWAQIAIATGYYDQAHLIDEFRAIAGATPPALLDELDVELVP